MGRVFVYGDTAKGSAGLIGLAKNAGQDCIAFALSRDEAQVLLGLGATSVLILRGDSDRIEDYAKAVARIIDENNADALLVEATVEGLDFAALVAGYANAGLASCVSNVWWDRDGFTTTRMVYGGAVEVTEHLTAPQIITWLPKGFEANPVENPSQDMREMAVEAETSRRVISSQSIAHDAVDIAEADSIVCVGMGFSNKDDIALAKSVAHPIGAELACTRPIAMDRQWMPADTYIGLSGKIVAPALYIGLGVSGQVQHAIGIRDSKIIVVVNNNKNASFFDGADYGIVGDLYEAIPLLAEALQRVMA